MKKSLLISMVLLLGFLCGSCSDSSSSESEGGGGETLSVKIEVSNIRTISRGVESGLDADTIKGLLVIRWRSQ